MRLRPLTGDVKRCLPPTRHQNCPKRLLNSTCTSLNKSTRMTYLYLHAGWRGSVSFPTQINPMLSFALRGGTPRNAHICLLESVPEQSSNNLLICMINHVRQEIHSKSLSFFFFCPHLQAWRASPSDEVQSCNNEQVGTEVEKSSDNQQQLNDVGGSAGLLNVRLSQPERDKYPLSSADV